ncbi:MAG TPA: acyltransferase [Candidatus Angelobacter sp.]|nr:acyltransferase [Candidatus Limnocylindria bacterium]HYL83945.1 acyltransferase [Candidatus Angelobacter sp.]
MNSSYARFREVRFFGSLDGLRALSIIGVIWFHSWWSTPYYPTLTTLPVLRQGEWGVHIFFAISGFLITTLLLREQQRSGNISIKDFYIRRSLRIWPLYYATVAIYVIIMLTFQRGSARAHTFFHYLPGFLTYTYTWWMTPSWPTGPFNLAWTLATEEQFYAFWPLVLRFFRGIRSSVVMIALLALRLAAGYGWTNRILVPGSLPARIVLSVAIPICLGVLLAQALDSERGFRWLYAVLGGKWAAPACLIALAICLIPEHPPVFVASLATAALVGACVIREDNGLAPILKLRPIAWIGVLSYGMYLLNSLSLHVVLSVLGRMGIPHPLFIFPCTVGLAVLAAFLSYRYFETPFLELKKRFAHVRPDPAAHSTAGIAGPATNLPVHP